VSEQLNVSPLVLRLPPARRSGADPIKLADQIRRFGDGTTGMPPLQVTRGSGGELMINDGVTRAFRIARLRPEDTIKVEVIDDRPNWSFAHLPTVQERI
jgi:hypothetical protein